MANEPTSIQPVVREIEKLMEEIRAAKVAPDMEWKRTRALMSLEAILQLLRSFCWPLKKSRSFFEFEFPPRA